MSRPMLEREHELAELAAAAAGAAAGRGSVVLLAGEAGIGKSAVVAAVRSVLPADGRLLVGYCDDLATRRALGPFRDLLGGVGPELTRALGEGGDRNQLLDALRAEFGGGGQPAVLVVEDAHWADEATLDVLRYLTRRAAGWPLVLVLTYRDDEIGRDHPLEPLLGLASRTERVRRLPLARLSPEAVRRLSGALDSRHVYAVTSGNPFFVTEVIAAGDAGHPPPTIVDAVLARVRTVDPATQDLLEQLAVVPSAGDRWLVDRLVPGGVPALAAAERRGLVTVAPSRVVFRHELIRRAIADSLPAARRIELNQHVVAALLGHERADLAAIVHHAAEAGDRAVIARYAPLAAAEAAAAGSHREAAAHLRLALEDRSGYPPAEQADLLDRYAIECYTNGDPQAFDAQHDAVRLRRTLGDARALGASLRWLSRIAWLMGDRRAAEPAAMEAIVVLSGAGDERLLALAYSNRSQLYMLSEQRTEAIAWGRQAARLARAAGMHVELGRLELATGRWDEAVRAAESVSTAPLSHRCPATVILARVQARRGEPGAAELVARAWEMAERLGELQRTAPAAAARAEHAWLHGGDPGAVAALETTYAEACRVGEHRMRGDSATG